MLNRYDDIRERVTCWLCGRTEADGIKFYRKHARCSGCISRIRSQAVAGIEMEKLTSRARELISGCLTQEKLQQLLTYDPATGQFSAKISWGKHTPGSRVGTLRPDGRRQIRIGGKLYLEHRIIWMLVHGEWPDKQIDHKDLARANNSLDNLRPCGNGPNNANKRTRKDSVSGIKGVRFDNRKKKWNARITVDWETRFLGYFDTKEEAHDAYSVAATEAFGEFARTA